MAATAALSPSSHQRGFSASRASTPGVPLKAERLLALGDSHRPNLQRASTEGNRLLALLTAKKELKDTFDRTPNSDLVNTRDWTVNDLFDTTTADIWSFTSPAPASKPASKSGVLRKQPPRNQNQTENNYYDPSRVPLRVSQQTSASAMRDMGLHKQAAVLGEPQSDRRARSSTMGHDPRRQKLDKLLGVTDYPVPNNAKLDITSYFTTTRPAPSISPELQRSNSAWTQDSDQSANAPPSFSELQKRPPLTRNGDSRLQIGPPQLVAYNSTVSLRPLPRAEEDVLKNAKMHRRKPPKGARNWFDALDVSSDEDDFDEDFNSLNLQPRPRTPPPSDRGLSRRVSTRRSNLEEQLPPRPSRDSHLARPDSRATSAGQHRGLQTTRSLADLHAGGQAYSGQVTTSHATNESVFSLESHDDFDADFVNATLEGTQYGEAAKVMDISKVRAKRLSHHPSYQKDAFSSRNGSISTDMTSGTIPMRLASDIHLPQRPRTSARFSSAAHIAPQLVSSEVPPAVPGQTRPSVSSDGARLMEVTDEEMALLEMMRHKRATMSKTSSPDGKLTSFTPRQSLEASRVSIAPKPLKLFPSNFSQDLDHTDALTSLRKEYGLLNDSEYDQPDNAPVHPAFAAPHEHQPEILQPRSYTPRGATSARATASTAADRSKENIRSVSQGQRPMTAHANGASFAAPRPLSPRGARRAQDINTHKRSFTQQGMPPVLDVHIPAIPQRNPNRTSLLLPSTGDNSENDDSDNQNGGIAVPPTPIDETRQSVCSTLPDTAPLSLPTLSSAVYRADGSSETTPTATSAASRELGSRPSPQVILNNTFSKSSQPSSHFQPLRSYTSPAGYQDLFPPLQGAVMRKPSDPSIYERQQLNPLCMNPPLEFVEGKTSPSAEGPRFSQLARPGSISRRPDHGLSHSPSTTVSPGTPDTPVGPQPIHPALQPGKPRQLASSPAIESLKQSAAESAGDKRGSTMSMTSVGEDVLAAWAELGGGTLHFRF